jgi:hypothetical protein
MNLHKEVYNMFIELSIKELAQLVELYKSGKITEYSFERELANNIEKITYPTKVSVSLITDKNANNLTFGITTLPEIGQKATITLLLDKEVIINNILSLEDVVKIVINEAQNYQQPLKEYSKFVVLNSNKECGLKEVLEVLLRNYKGSLDNMAVGIPEIYKKLINAKILPEIEDLSKELTMLTDGRERVDQFIERVAIKFNFPKLLIDKAKEIAEKMKSDYMRKEYIAPEFSDETPSMNLFDQRRKALSDGTYTNIKSKEISPFYKPSTN